jgi:hypothetical protein
MLWLIVVASSRAHDRDSIQQLPNVIPNIFRTFHSGDDRNLDDFPNV